MKDTKERIVRQALSYFNENDYERASLNDIAGALGVTKGAIYHYFGSKDELFKETVYTAIGDLENVMSGMWDASAGLSFRDMIGLWFNFPAMIQETEETMGMDFFSNYGNMIYLMFTAIKKFPEVREKVENIYTESIDGLEQLLVQAKAAGEINGKIDTRALAFEMTAFAEGALLLGSVAGKLDLADMGPRCFDNFWLRVRPEEDG